DERYCLDEEQRAAQQAHLSRLASIERYPEIRFANADRLAVELLRSQLAVSRAMQALLASAGVVQKPTNLPYRSIGEIFKGREEPLEALARDLGRVADIGASPARATVLHGMGGVGKTRLALEYAWRHADEYTALLFVSAGSSEALSRN